MKSLLIAATEKLRRRRHKKEAEVFAEAEALREESNAISRTHEMCMNCHVPLTGPFCHLCGQKDDDLRRPIWTFVREIVDNVFSADSRFIKSSILLVAVPGGLTRAYMMGRRARFVHPLRLYFAVSIIFFLIISIMNIAILDINVTRKPDAPLLSEVIEENKEQDKQNVAERIEERIDEIEMQLTNQQQEAIALIEQNAALDAEEKEELIKLIENGSLSPNLVGDAMVDSIVNSSDDFNFDLGDLPYNVSLSMFVPITDEPREGLLEEDLQGLLKEIEENADEGEGEVSDYVSEVTLGFARTLKDPQLLNDLFNKWLPRALIVLVPVFALIVRMFHWGKQRYYLNQIVFSLHFHCFLFILLMALMAIVPLWGGGMGMSIFWWGASLYLIISLKVAQNQGFIRAFLKAGFIWVSYFMIMSGVLSYVVLEGLREL